MNYLPEHFSPEKSIITVVAGRGDYPKILISRILEHNIHCRLVALHEETHESVINLLPKEHVHCIHIGQLGKLLSIIKQTNTTHVMLAGQIRPMRLFNIKPDWRVIWLFTKIKERNASTIFGSLCKEIEKRGVCVLDARCFMQDDIVTRDAHPPVQQQQLDYGIHIASEVARLNIGQSVVIRNGTVIAVEGFDGTNAMLKHCKELHLKNMMFIKTSKPEHDYRFDVPVFGMRTLELIHEANIRIVALESEKTIILDKARVLSHAKQLGVKIFGY